MAYTVLDTTGATITIDKGTKITSIAGRAVDLIFSGISAEDTAGRRRGRVLSRTPVILAPFTGVNTSTLAFEYGTPVTVLAQTEEKMVSRWDPSENGTSQVLYGSSLAPKSEVDIFLNNADLTQDFGILYGQALDAVRGLMAPGLYAVNYVTVPPLTGAQEDAGYANANTPVPVPLTCIRVDWNAQYETIDGIDQKCGDALIVCTRSQATEATLQNADYFTISYLSQTAVKYTIWNQRGIRYLDTYHYGIYLQRMK